MPRLHNYSANPEAAQLQEIKDIVLALEAMEVQSAAQTKLLARIVDALEAIAAKP